MHWFKRKPKPSKAPEIFTPSRIQFLGEQTGPVEDEVKAALRQILTGAPDVQKAYLARVSYGDSTPYSVALCICSTSPEAPILLKQLGSAFAAIFKADQRLDILFMRPDQEEDVRKVCRPFFGEG